MRIEISTTPYDITQPSLITAIDTDAFEVEYLEGRYKEIVDFHASNGVEEIFVSYICYYDVEEEMESLLESIHGSLEYSHPWEEMQTMLKLEEAGVYELSEKDCFKMQLLIDEGMEIDYDFLGGQLGDVILHEGSDECFEDIVDNMCLSKEAMSLIFDLWHWLDSKQKETKLSLEYDISFIRGSDKCYELLR